MQISYVNKKKKLKKTVYKARVKNCDKGDNVKNHNVYSYREFMIDRTFAW